MLNSLRMSFLTGGLFFIVAFSNNLIQINHPPNVTIQLPGDDARISSGMQVPYDIIVSDQEDGESKYEEINFNEIYLEVSYFKNQAEAREYIKVNDEPTGLVLIKSFNCFTCHTPDRPMVGPSFIDIASRYLDDHDRKDFSQHIINGSANRWGNVAIMPAHPQISQNQAEQMRDWILNLKGSPTTTILSGAKGIIQVDEAKPGWTMVLKASYRDHGSKSANNAITGFDFKPFVLQ